MLDTALLFTAAALITGFPSTTQANSKPEESGAVAPTAAATAAATTVKIDSVQELLKALPDSKNKTDSDLALAEAAKQVTNQPTDPVGFINLGDAIAQLVRETENPALYPLALFSYDEALKLAPEQPKALTGISWVYGVQHAFDQSIEWADRALKADPGNPTAHGLLGDAALDRGDYEAALDFYQKMMDLRPDLSSWSRGAYLLWINGDRNRAKILMQKAIRSGGPFAENTSWCRAKLAMMYFNEGAYVPAAQAIEVPLSASTKNTHVLLAAARIACALQDFKTAKEYYQRVLEDGPKHEALVGLGDIANLQGNKEEAESYFKKVEELHQHNELHNIHDNMAMAKFYADHDRNLKEAVRLAELDKGTGNVLEVDIQAWAYFKAGDQKNAVESMKIALSRQTPDAELRYHAGLIAAKSGDITSAKTHLQNAVSLNPQFSLTQGPIATQKLTEMSSGSASLK